MTRVGEASEEHRGVELLGDVVADGDTAEWQVRRRQSFGHGHQVGNGVPVLDGKPLAGTSESSHDLVGNREDVVVIAQRANTRDVPGRWDEDSVGADDRLEEYRGN